MSSIFKLKNGKTYSFMKGASEYMIDVCDKFLDLETGDVR